MILIRGKIRLLLALVCFLGSQLALAQESSFSEVEKDFVKKMSSSCASFFMDNPGADAKFVMADTEVFKKGFKKFPIAVATHYASCSQQSPTGLVAALEAAGGNYAKPIAQVYSAENGKTCADHFRAICTDPLAKQGLQLCEDGMHLQGFNESESPTDARERTGTVCGIEKYQQVYSSCLSRVLTVEQNVHIESIQIARRELESNQSELLASDTCFKEKAQAFIASGRALLTERKQYLADQLQPGMKSLAEHAKTRQIPDIERARTNELLAGSPSSLDVGSSGDISEKTFRMQSFADYVESSSVPARSVSDLEEESNRLGAAERAISQGTSGQNTDFNSANASASNGISLGTLGTLGLAGAGVAAGTLSGNSHSGSSVASPNSTGGDSSAASGPLANGQNNGPDASPLASNNDSGNTPSDALAENTESVGSSTAPNSNFASTDLLGAKNDSAKPASSGAEGSSSGASSSAALATSAGPAAHGHVTPLARSSVSYEEGGSAKRASVNLSSAEADESIEGMLKGLLGPGEEAKNQAASNSARGPQRKIASVDQAPEEAADVSVSLWQRVQHTMATQVERGNVLGPKNEF